MTSRKEIELKRVENLNKLETGYRSNVNRFEYDSGNSIKHEMAKFICFILLRNGVSAEELPRIFPNRLIKNCCGFEEYCNSNAIENPSLTDSVHLSYIDEMILLGGQKFEEEWRRPVIVTEARFKKEGYVVEDGYIPDLQGREFIKKNKMKLVKKFEDGKKNYFEKQRRADLYILDTNQIVEIETNPKITKRGSNVITIRI